MNAADLLADLPEPVRVLILADVTRRLAEAPAPTPESVEAVGQLVQRFAGSTPIDQKGKAA